jgi:hypothetical protein
MCPLGKYLKRVASSSRKADQEFWEKSKSNPKLSARDEYVAIGITSYSTKDTLEF